MIIAYFDGQLAVGLSNFTKISDGILRISIDDRHTKTKMYVKQMNNAEKKTNK